MTSVGHYISEIYRRLGEREIQTLKHKVSPSVQEDPMDLQRIGLPSNSANPNILLDVLEEKAHYFFEENKEIVYTMLNTLDKKCSSELTLLFDSLQRSEFVNLTLLYKCHASSIFNSLNHAAKGIVYLVSVHETKPKVAAETSKKKKIVMNTSSSSEESESRS